MIRILESVFNIYIDKLDLQQLNEKLAQDEQRLAPILLLDYEYYETLSIASANQAIGNDDKQKALNTLLDNPSLPKILLSMKPERRIPSILLDKYEGFLSKYLRTFWTYWKYSRLC